MERVDANYFGSHLRSGFLIGVKLYDKSLPWYFSGKVKRSEEEIEKLEISIRKELEEKAQSFIEDKPSYIERTMLQAKNEAESSLKNNPDTEITVEKLTEKIWHEKFSQRDIMTNTLSANELAQKWFFEKFDKFEWQRKIRSHKKIDNIGYNLKLIFEHIQYNSNLKWRNQDFIEKLFDKLESAWFEWDISNNDRQIDNKKHVDLSPYDWIKGRKLLYDFIIDFISNIENVKIILEPDCVNENIEESIIEEDAPLLRQYELKSTVYQCLQKDETNVRFENLANATPTERLELIVGWIRADNPEAVYSFDFINKKTQRSIQRYAPEILKEQKEKNEDFENRDTGWIYETFKK